MVNRFIISLIFLAVTSFGITAKSITLNELDISKIPTLEKVLKTVSEEGDSIVHEKKFFSVTLKEYRGGLYLFIQLVKGTVLDGSNYIGYTYVDKNLFTIKSRTKIDSIIKTNRKRQFTMYTLDLLPAGIDGVIYWVYFVLNDEIHRIKFKSAW